MPKTSLPSVARPGPALESGAAHELAAILYTSGTTGAPKVSC